MRLLSDILTITDPQKIFDHVVEKLAAQGKASMARHPDGPDEEDIVCVYRNETTGERCAVGHVLKDEILTPTVIYVGGMQELLSALEIEWPSSLGVDLASFLEDMQGAHDLSETRPQLVRALQGVAMNWELEEDAVDQHMNEAWQAGGTWQ